MMPIQYPSRCIILKIPGIYFKPYITFLVLIPYVVIDPVMLYFATSILVRTRIVQFWYVPELFITCSNSRTYQNCAILIRTRIVRLYNSGTRFLPELLLQFWDVPELSVNYFPIACLMTQLVSSTFNFAAN